MKSDLNLQDIPGWVTWETDLAYKFLSGHTFNEEFIPKSVGTWHEEVPAPTRKGVMVMPEKWAMDKGFI